MKLREAILEEHTKANTVKITQWIGSNQQRIAELMQLFMNDEYRVVQRAAMIVSYVAKAQPELMKPYISQLSQRLGDTHTHIAVKRNILRIFQEAELPEAIHSDLMNTCFDAIADPVEAIAVRAFALGILGRLSVIYPEIKNEIRLVIEDVLSQNPTAAFRSRAKKVLKFMGK